MSESDSAKLWVDQAVQFMHERNLELEKENIRLQEQSKSDKESIEFNKLQAEFWAAECISEQRKALVSIYVMIIVCVLSFASIGMNILIGQ